MIQNCNSNGSLNLIHDCIIKMLLFPLKFQKLLQSKIIAKWGSFIFKSHFQEEKRQNLFLTPLDLHMCRREIFETKHFLSEWFMTIPVKKRANVLLQKKMFIFKIFIFENNFSQCIYELHTVAPDHHIHLHYTALSTSNVKPFMLQRHLKIIIGAVL